MSPLLSPHDRLITLPEGVPELTLGWGVLAWAHKYLRHANGPDVGKRWTYTPEQARFILWWYSLDQSGQWLYYHAVRRLAKGSGKSPFAATLALAEFVGPVRLADFDSSVLGGAVGKPVDMPLVQIAATSQSQTANTMRQIRAMSPRGGRLATDFKIDVGKQQFFKQPEGSLENITSSPASAEGAESTAVIADETEHWLGNAGAELFNTLTDNLTKSGNRMLETANAWKPDAKSVAETTYSAWIDQELGRSKNDRKVLYDCRRAPADTDLSDNDSLRRGLAVVYEDCPWTDIDAIVTRIWSTASRPDDSKRKYLNWPTAAADSWCDPQEWQKLARPDIEVSPGEEICMFFDGSKSKDHTALVGCRISDGHVFVVDVWAPERTPDGDVKVVDVEDVDAAVWNAFQDYTVVAFYADVREFESFTKLSWPQEHKHHLRMWAVPGGKMPEPIAWDMRSKVYDFTQAAELVEAEILEQSFTHDGHPVLAEHVGNARRHQGRWGISVRKETHDSPKKIDACVAMIGARMVRKNYLSSDTDGGDSEAYFA